MALHKLFSAFLDRCTPDITTNCVNLPIVNTENQVANILQIVFGIIAAVSVIYMVLSGLKFITAAGNPDQVAKARQAIIYGAIGLVISASAGLIVTFVLGRL